MDKLLNIDIHEDLDDDSLDELYNSLIEQNIENIRKEHYKKIIEIAIYLLKYKGEQLKYFQDQSEAKSTGNDESTTQRINMDNERGLRRIVDKLEFENSSLKNKIKEMNDEIINLQKRLLEITVTESDKDSDPLSELDRTEDLLKKITTKNKHIKKLIRDIESMHIQNIEQSKKIIELESTMEQMKSTESDLRNQLKANDIKNKELCNTINQLNIEIKSIESNLKYLEDEREKSNLELNDFLEKLEERAKSWKGIIDQKEQQLDSLRKKYEILSKNENLMNLNSGSEDQENDFQNLLQAVQEREIVINELEAKIKSMTEEMMISTRLMNKLSKDREAEQKLRNNKINVTSLSVEDSLQKRCQELADMLEKADEENILKSKLANDALKTLNAYQKGEEGLSKALRKIVQLEQKLNSRDKQIKALVMEVNSLHEISQENTILRKKLNIPEDMVISTSNLMAKQRNKDKLLERLNLKLRASEEIRLQLKIDKNDLKKEIIDLRGKLKTPHVHTDNRKTKNTDTESNSSAIALENVSCTKCVENSNVIEKLEEKYSSIVEENENLRIGMHEILEKIREYDASSDHIIIDCTILQKLLHALDARSISGWYHPAMRMQNELIAVKERELALREKIQIVEKAFDKNKKKSIVAPVIPDENSSSTSSSVISNHTYTKHNQNEEDQNNLKKKSFTIETYEIDDDKLTTDSEIKDKQRSLILENETLNCFKIQYFTLLEQLNSSEESFKQYCGNVIEKHAELELKHNIQNKTIDFLKEDFDEVLTQFKSIEMKNLKLVSDLRAQLNNKNYDAQKKLQRHKKYGTENVELENAILKEKYLALQSEMAYLVSNIFNENYLSDFKEEDSSNIAIIKDNMDIDFITLNEFEKMEQKLKNLKKEIDEIIVKNIQLQEAKQIVEDELNLNQKLLLNITDNHIDLRHLIADLQTGSENSYLIAKLRRELNQAKDAETKLCNEKEKIEKSNQKLEEKLKIKEKEHESTLNDHKFKEDNLQIKIKFLKKYIFNLQEKYCKYTPLIKLTDFVLSYKKYLEKLTTDSGIDSKKIDDLIEAKIISTKSVESEDLVKLVKFEIKCNYLEEQVNAGKAKLEIVQEDYNKFKLASIEECGQWKTIQALFAEHKPETEQKIDKNIQTESRKLKSIGINTDIKTDIAINKSELRSTSTNRNDAMFEENFNMKTNNTSPQRLDTGHSSAVMTNISSLNQSLKQSPNSLEIVYLENQLKQAMNLASQRSLLLLESENSLAEANGRIKEMEKLIKNLKKNSIKNDDQEINQHQKSEMFESTMQSLQALINEKDTTLNHYQNLLRTEREQHVKSCETYDKEIIVLKRKQNELEDALHTKDIELLELRTMFVHKHNNSITDNTQDYQIEESEIEFDGNQDNNNLDEISDEKLEEMFMDESKMLTPQSENLCEIKQNGNVKSIHFKEYKNREQFWENIVKAKDDEINQLKEKLQQNNRKKDLSENHEIEQLRVLLEDKDKHINDLMETLTNFHDDQQKFFSETSFYSADQFNQLGSNLTRSETTNKILHTQIEALKRQLNNLSAREKQARDLANSLKNQLIKRPVVSIKSESKAKADQLQKRIQQLELDLEESKKEVQKQKNTIEAKRTKNAIEVNLWEKQKRHQQTAEKLKIKLEETEKSLERTRSLLNVARTTINRLEREKQLDDTKKTKCCRAPSCPNLTDQNSARSSPYSGIDTPAQQQRKIFTLDMSSKGINVAVELEKLQEKLSEIEAKNIRLEARNIQLQLESDLSQQGDEQTRLQKRIKYLEDYILALKEELAKYEAQRELVGNSHQNKNPTTHHQEQTILALRRIVEKLKVENKNLKDGKNYPSSKTTEKQKQPPTELYRLQQLYTDALNKIATLQVELQLRNNCHEIPSKESANSEFIDEIKFLKEQLIKKTQLLEKAKILLTRAAAREKVFKDQLEIWKRKCSELQNVPVIEEISE